MSRAPSPKKYRADELLVLKKLVESRNKAQAFIMAGKVKFLNPRINQWELVKKAGQSLLSSTEFAIDSNQDVGRGTLKLREAFRVWPQLKNCFLNPHSVALDVGASTGGFTQVLLEQGASRVVALDVGTNQLHERLRQDSRVISLEQQHVLRVTPELWTRAGVQPPFDMIVSDLSFISLTKVIDVVGAWLKEGASWIMLVKPQFELGPKKAAGGIVRNEADRLEAISLVRTCIESSKGLVWKEVIESPITGSEGNKEYLAWVMRK